MTDETSDESTEENERPSRTEERLERKRVQATLDALTKRLAGLSPKVLGTLGLDEGLTAEVRHYATMRKGPAMARQRRLTARLLRAYDVDEVNRSIDAALGKGGLSARSGALERWRTRLVEEGDAALEELLAAHPSANGQRIRQATRAAVAEAKGGATGKRFKALHRVLSEELPPA